MKKVMLLSVTRVLVKSLWSGLMDSRGPHGVPNRLGSAVTALTAVMLYHLVHDQVNLWTPLQDHHISQVMRRKLRE